METKIFVRSIVIVMMMGAWLANANRVLLEETNEQAQELMGGKDKISSGGSYCTIM